MDGLWAEQILEHVNPQIDFAGADYFGFDKIVNGYQVQFNAPATRVDLVGSNNNIADVLISNGITVVPSNSAGGQRILDSNANLPPEQEALIQEVHEAHYNRRKHDAVNDTLTIYDTDKVTPKKVFDTNADLSDITPQ